MRATVFVRLKEGVLDPQGLAIQKSLQALGYDEVQGVRQGKVFEVEITGDDVGRARERLEEMCRRLLANPVIEDFRLEFAEAGS